MEGKILSAEDREFFALVSRAAFANPFGAERVELDRKISGSSRPGPWREIVPEAVREVNKRIGQLDAGGAVKIQDFEEADHDLIEHVFLFDVFHQFIKQFDRLIIEQINRGEESLRVDFAGEALAALASRGFSSAAASRYFSLFYTALD
jgi:hypothetical protein